MISHQTRKAEQQLGGVIGNHNGPVHTVGGGEKQAGEKHGVADEEQGAADSGHPPRQCMGGEGRDGKAAGNGQDRTVDDKQRNAPA